jgi:hypothetical protein
MAEPGGEGARLNPAAAAHAGEFGPDASSIHRVMSGSGGGGKRLSPAAAHAGESSPYASSIDRVMSTDETEVRGWRSGHSIGAEVLNPGRCVSCMRPSSLAVAGASSRCLPPSGRVLPSA